MAAKQPDKDLATALAGALGLAMNIDVRFGLPLAPTDAGAADVQLWVYSTGGPAPSHYMERDAGDGHIRAQYTASLTVRVRAKDADAFDVPQALARSVVTAAASIILTIAGYDDLSVDVSDPLDLGPNDEGQQEWNVPFTMVWTA